MSPKLFLGILSVCIFIGTFTFGYIQGCKHEHNKWLEAEADYKDMIAQKNIALDLIEDKYNQIKTNLLIAQKESQNAIIQNKILINSNNRISKHHFLQYIGTPIKVSESQNIKPAINKDESIPADSLLTWIIGLQGHDEQCVEQLNSLIEAVEAWSN